MLECVNVRGWLSVVKRGVFSISFACCATATTPGAFNIYYEVAVRTSCSLVHHCGLEQF